MTFSLPNGDFAPSAKVIADSITPAGNRLTTVEVNLHRFVLAELNTHRVFSRNSASSRAIPVRRMLDNVARVTAVPLVWASEQKGMQGGDEIDDPATARDIWYAARDAAIAHAEKLIALGVHKSIVNRLLEPFSPHTVIISATDWDNFFDQRCSPLAQPEIQIPATLIRNVITGSLPIPVEWKQFHLPYLSHTEKQDIPEQHWPAVSAARSARVSYLTHDGRRDWEEDLRLYRRLIQAEPPHWSPLEHPAVAHPLAHNSGNFTGWRQLRHIVAGA